MRCSRVGVIGQGGAGRGSEGGGWARGEVQHEQGREAEGKAQQWRLGCAGSGSPGGVELSGVGTDCDLGIPAPKASWVRKGPPCEIPLSLPLCTALFSNQTSLTIARAARPPFFCRRHAAPRPAGSAGCV